MAKNKKPPSFLKHDKLWAKNNNNIWLVSTLKLHRNIANFKFSPKLDKEQRMQIAKLIEGELLKCKALDNPDLFLAEDLDPKEKEFLQENYLLIQSLQQAHTGEAFILDKSQDFLGIVNLREHLQLQIVDVDRELESGWNKLLNIETSLGKTLDYAFSQKFGFLTADTNYCGTGLIVYVFLHLPALNQTGKLHNTLKIEQDKSITATGISGNLDNLLGDILTLHNNHSLGLTEEDIISNLHSMTTKLIIAEKGARAELKTSKDPIMRDKISRAFGLLMHSFQLETRETFDAISLCKLGLDLEWISGVDHQFLNQLMFTCRRAHLTALFPEETTENLPQRRAQYIREQFEKTSIISHAHQ